MKSKAVWWYHWHQDRCVTIESLFLGIITHIRSNQIKWHSVAMTSIRLLFWPKSLNVAMGIKYTVCLGRMEQLEIRKMFIVSLLSNNVYWNLSWQVLRNSYLCLLKYTSGRRRKNKIIAVSHCQLLQHGGLRANDIRLIVCICSRVCIPSKSLSMLFETLVW